MTELKDLSPQELADLLDWPLDKARKWLEVAVSVSHVEERGSELPFGDFESRPSLRRESVRELMHLPVEKVEELKRTGKLKGLYPYSKSSIPRDAETRLRYLRELLEGEVEFETRYPVAYRLLFGGSPNVGLPLPSFDVRVLKNEPRESVWRHHWFGNWEVGQYSSDAYSVTFRAEDEAGPPWTWDKEADQSLAPPDLGFMRGVLLAVLSREESAERLDPELHNETIREEVGAPAWSSVRLTDLRLAIARELEDKTALERALRPLLESLERPITTNTVLQWKWDVLFDDEERRGRRSREEERRDEDARIKRVSFAATALLLFLDFDMPRLEEASSFQLANQIATLADIIRKVSKSLNANARSLERLLAFRDPNRPRRAGQELYDALVDYRMGKDPKRIAEDLGITPYKSSPSEPGGEWGGTREWERRLEERLERGAKIEEDKYPLATVVLANRDKPRVRTKARQAYRTYERVRLLTSHEDNDYAHWFHIGHAIHVKDHTDWGLQIITAYVQLGSCLKRGLNPFPTHLDFNT